VPVLETYKFKDIPDQLKSWIDRFVFRYNTEVCLIKYGQAETLSGTAYNLAAAIPDWAKEIILPVSGLSTNGTSQVLLQLGTAGAPEVTGYAGAALKASGATSVVNDITLSAGFALSGDNNAGTRFFHGAIHLSKVDPATNTWACEHNLGMSETGRMVIGAGTKALAGPLDTITFTTAGGVNTFDAGIVNSITRGIR
jgi:hypothetical protein